MTKRTIKLDASSLIYLAKAGILDLIADLYQEVIITGAVYQEAVIEGKRRGHPDAFMIERAVADGRVRVLQLGPVARERLVKAGFPLARQSDGIWGHGRETGPSTLARQQKPSLKPRSRDAQRY